MKNKDKTKEHRINELKTSEIQSRQAEEIVRTMLDNVVMGISMISPKMEIIWLNKTFKEWFPKIDVRKKSLCYQSFYSPPKERICDYCPTIKAFKTGEIHFAETGACADGRIYFVFAAPVKDDKGNIIYVVETVEDITERKRVEEVLRQSENKFRTLAEESPNMIFINREGRFVYVNKKCEEVMGYTREEFYSEDFDFMNLIASEYRGLVRENFRRHMGGEEVQPYEYKILTKDGREIISIHTTKLIDFEGERAILWIVTDITERKEAERRLTESETHLRTIIESEPECVKLLAADGTILDMNPAGLAMVEAESPQEVIGKSVYPLISNEYRPAFKALNESVFQGRNSGV